MKYNIIIIERYSKDMQQGNMNNSVPYAKNIIILLDERKLKNMNISDVRIRKTMNEPRLRAVVSLTLENAIAIHDIKIIQGDERLFVAMPSRRDESGNFRDIVHPISPNAREELEKEILSAYNGYLNSSHSQEEFLF